MAYLRWQRTPAAAMGPPCITRLLFEGVLAIIRRCFLKKKREEGRWKKFLMSVGSKCFLFIQLWNDFESRAERNCGRIGSENLPAAMKSFQSLAIPSDLLLITLVCAVGFPSSCLHINSSPSGGKENLVSFCPFLCSLIFK